MIKVKVVEGTRIINVIEVGDIHDVDYFKQQVMIWEAVSKEAAIRLREAKQQHKQSSAADKKKGERLKVIEEWLTRQGMNKVNVDKTIKRLARYDVTSEHWAPFVGFGVTKRVTNKKEAVPQSHIKSEDEE